MCASWHRSQVKLQIDFEMTVLRTPIVHDARRSDLLHRQPYQKVVKTACIRRNGDRMYAESDDRLRSRPGNQYSMHGSTSRHMRSLNRRPAGSSAALVTRSQRRRPPAMRALSLPCVMRALSSPPLFESLNPLVLLGKKP